MSTSTVLGQDYGYFKGLGNLGNENAILPPQAIPNNKKNKNWKKACLDNLEREGLKQYRDNLPMGDYYKMISGEMAYVDISSDDKDLMTSYLDDFKKDKLNIPSHIRHYDLMYPIVSKIVGDWAMQYDKLRFDTTDEVSANEFIRERTYRLSQYAQSMFKMQLERRLLQEGITPIDDQSSEEERKRYEQEQQRIIQEYYPEKIDMDMKKNWKTEAAQWAEKTWDRDYERYRMHILESMEARDILLVGKSARHYRVGYDYYFPEYWHPIELFHSKEVSLNRLEDAEFAGRVKWYSVTELINNYGDILSENERVSIYKSYFGQDYTEFNSSTTFDKSVSILGEGQFQLVQTPFKGYSDHKLALEFEEATGVPQSERLDVATGEVTPSFSMPLDNDTPFSYGARVSQSLRTDFEIRTDTIQTTEVYWKGSKKIGLLTYRTHSGYLDTVEVDEDILPDVLSKYNIKTIKKISLVQYDILKPEDKENTLVWVDTPVVYRGVKIRVSGIGLEDDIYKVEELPYQIRGEKGNIFDVKLPVSGYIGNSFCKLIRPYQIAYNYFLNQTLNYGMKEVGAFFVIDVNSVPTEYFGLDDDSDALLAIRNIAKTTGLLPTDVSRNALAQSGGGLAFNPMHYVEANFTGPMQRNLQLSQTYKMMAFETLGLNPTSMGSPSQYSTVEGIQVGQKAYFAQTYNIEQILMENKRANVEVHMSVAQYCQSNNKDVNYLYMAGDDELAFIHSIKDDNFELRKIDVRSTYNSTKNMMFQQLKQSLIQNNTMGNDAMALVELFMSDDFLELKEAAMRARMFSERQMQQQREHEQQMQQAKDQKEMKIHSDEMMMKEKAIEGQVQSAVIRSMGYGARSGEDASDEMKYIKDTGDLYLKKRDQDIRGDVERSKIEADLKKASDKVNAHLSNIELQREKIALDREKLATQRYVAERKNYDSMINKN